MISDVTILVPRIEFIRAAGRRERRGKRKVVHHLSYRISRYENEETSLFWSFLFVAMKIKTKQRERKRERERERESLVATTTNMKRLRWPDMIVVEKIDNKISIISKTCSHIVELEHHKACVNKSFKSDIVSFVNNNNNNMMWAHHEKFPILISNLR